VAADAWDDQAAKSFKALKTVLNRTVRYRWIAFNPCQIQGGGQEHPAQRPVPEDDIEVQEITEAFEQFPPFGPRCKALVPVSAFGGAFRTDGMLSLRYRDIDTKRKQVHVGTKTEASKRWVYLPDGAWEALMEHMHRSDQYGPFSGEAPDGWVFSAPRGGRIWRRRPRDRRAEEDRTHLSARWGARAGEVDPEPPQDNIVPIRRRSNQVDMVEKAAALVKAKGLRVRFSVAALASSVALIVAGTLTAGGARHG
jgi:hypothetical protein